MQSTEKLRDPQKEAEGMGFIGAITIYHSYAARASVGSGTTKSSLSTDARSQVITLTTGLILFYGSAGFVGQ